MGGILSKPKTPAAPDPAATAEAQAKANQVTQITPEGNLIYGTYQNGQFVPGEGNTALQVTETPFQQALRGGGEDISLDLLASLQQGGAGNLAPVRTASQIEQGLSPLTQDFSADARQAQQANYEANLALLQPQMDRQRRQIEQRLADQGLPIGSDAYQEELDRLERSQQQQLQSLSQSSVAAGNDRSNQLAQLLQSQQAQQFNTQAGLTSLENQARASQFGELGALLGFASPFQQYSTPGVDVAGAINSGYGNQLAQSQAQQQASQQQASNIGSLASAGAFLFSDITLKENIKLCGTEAGYNIYEFNYIGDDKTYRGVMAQEVELTNPEAVKEIDGYKAVNYDAIGVEFREVSSV